MTAFSRRPGSSGDVGSQRFEVRVDDARQAMLLEKAARALEGDVSALAVYDVGWLFDQRYRDPGCATRPRG